mmetsp:Transcript_25515/g.59460  ORF Transcript_25515/g.59460 Transcript_25515/m.59460 type:complete len:206 (+) Transcript_25515:6220-6837(+)
MSVGRFDSLNSSFELEHVLMRVASCDRRHARFLYSIWFVIIQRPPRIRGATQKAALRTEVFNNTSDLVRVKMHRFLLIDSAGLDSADFIFRLFGGRCVSLSLSTSLSTSLSLGLVPILSLIPIFIFSDGFHFTTLQPRRGSKEDTTTPLSVAFVQLVVLLIARVLKVEQEHGNEDGTQRHAHHQLKKVPARTEELKALEEVDVDV